MPLRVLFLCTGNAARSQMAEALLRSLSKGAIDVASAGSSPEGSTHPLAVLTLKEKFGIDISDSSPKPLSLFQAEQFDFVITVCDRANEICPTLPGDPTRIHWSFEDPAAIVDPDLQRRAFEHIATGLAARLRIWLSLQEIQKRLTESSIRPS